MCNGTERTRRCAHFRRRLIAPMAADGIVRLSKIEVYTEYLEEYMKYAVEVGETSLRTEPGVVTMYAVSEKENPCKITILENYASRAATRCSSTAGSSVQSALAAALRPRTAR